MQGGARLLPGPPLQAPEVIEQSPDNVGFRSDGSGRPDDGYDEAADIWSLGITAMEVRVSQACVCACCWRVRFWARQPASKLPGICPGMPTPLQPPVVPWSCG